MPIILLKPIGKGKFNLKSIKGLVEKELRAEAKEQLKLLQKPTDSWKGSKPRFKSIVIATPKQIGAHTFADLGTEGGKKFMWLDEGTKVRWAVMSGDWRSKTRVGSWKSGGGKGRVVIYGRGAMMKRKMKARPGIKARGWTKLATQERKIPFRNRMARMFKIYAANLGRW